MIIIAEVSELTRKIKLPTDRVLLVNGDYQVDGIAFKLPTSYEGDFDFSTGAARVHWTGVDKVEHTNLLTDKDASGRPLWIMPSELTQGGHGVIEFAVSFVATDATAAVTKRWISDPVSFRNRRTVNGSNEDEEAEEETTYDRLASAIAAVRAAQASVDKVNEVLAGITNSSPVVVATVADLSNLDVTKHQLAIVRADGYLYYYDGSAWQKGIKYGSYELDTTLTEPGKAADAAAVGAEVSAIKEDLIDNFDKINVFIEKEEKNLVNLDNCTYGYTLKWQDGTLVENRDYLVTEFLPIEEDVIYQSNQAKFICFYDSEKTYLGYKGGLLKDVFSSLYDGVAYVRASALKSNKDLLAICKTKYYSPEGVSGEDYTAYSDKANDLFDKGMARLLESGSDLVVKGKNLFDWKTDEYIGFQYAGNGNKLSYINNFDSDGIPTNENTQIALPKYFRVNEGQTIFCNYALWFGRYYDADKNLLGAIPATNDAYQGFVAPEGCAYVRLNIKGTNNPTVKGRIGSLEEMKNLKVYVVDTEQSVAPKPPAVLRPYQIDGSFVAPNFLDYCIPTMNSSEFLSAMKCLTIREVNKRDHAWRFGNFNMWVMNGTRGWNTTRKMLMDYGVDFCGFEECNSTASIAEFMKGWQFPYGFTTNLTDGEDAIDKGFVSRFEVISSTKLHFTTLSSNSSYLNCKVQLPRYMDVHNPLRVLSIYVVHFAITTQANKIAIANELLEQIATDTSDFIVIAGDTNDFAVTDEEKYYWRTLEDGGFAPVLPMSSKTVTQDMLKEPEDDPEKNWRNHAIDQFFISSNIEAVSYGVVNTKDEYADEDCNKATSTDGEAALSDHDFVYADLRFNYDVVRSGLQ